MQTFNSLDIDCTPEDEEIIVETCWANSQNILIAWL
jgi:hypothetical protein